MAAGSENPRVTDHSATVQGVLPEACISIGNSPLLGHHFEEVWLKSLGNATLVA